MSSLDDWYHRDFPLPLLDSALFFGQKVHWVSKYTYVPARRYGVGYKVLGLDFSSARR